MTVVLATVLSMINTIKKKSNVCFVVTLLFLWTIMAFTFGDADEMVYVSRYNESHLWIGQTEFLFSLLVLVANKIGLSFVQFKAVFTAIELVLIGSTVKRYAKYPNIVLMCYMIVPFMLNVTQMRNALATSIFLFSSRFLFEGERKSEKIKLFGRYYIDWNDVFYLVGIMFATMIHTASFIWIVFLVAKKFELRECIILTTFFDFLILFVITPNNIAKLMSVISKGAATRMLSYTTTDYQNSEWRHYSQIVFVLIFATIVITAFLLIRSKRNQLSYTKETELVLKMNVCVLVIVGLMVRYTQECYRMQEALFVLNYIALTNAIPPKYMCKVRFSKSVLEMNILLIVYVSFSAWFLIFHYLIPTVVIPVVQNNYFWNIIF